ncbi:MAG: hypothetical protein J1E02_05165, partial [Coprobacter sp.]|nr:hypothetical protein [Coprobacter sp.]
EPRSSDEYKYEVISRGGNYDTYDTNCATRQWRILCGNIKNDMTFPGGEIWFTKIGFRVVRYDK